jgi:hypothetical protein
MVGSSGMDRFIALLWLRGTVLAITSKGAVQSVRL